MMTTNLIVIVNVKQLRTDGSFRILLPFFRTSWSGGVLNSEIFNSFHNRVEFGTILESLRNFGRGGRVETPLGTPLGWRQMLLVKEYQLQKDSSLDLHLVNRLLTFVAF